MPARQVQDVTLPKKDGLKQGWVDAIRVDEVRDAAVPVVNLLCVLGGEFVLAFG